MIELSDDVRRRFDRRRKQAEREFNREVESVRLRKEEDVEAYLSNTLKSYEIATEVTRRASLKFFGSLLFFWLGELSAQQEPVDELRQAVNRFVVVIRKQVLESMWPNPPGPTHQRKWEEQEFDRALIKWLAARRQWRDYEVKILRELTPPAPADDLPGEADPLKYFLNWPLEGLSAKARRSISSDLLGIHAARLEGTRDCAECCRRAYDLIAEEFDRAGLLREVLLRESIPEMIADASGGGDWSLEPMGRAEPTGIFNVRFGSQFYPPWRVETILESLEGRRSYWNGRLMLKASLSSEPGSGPGRRPQSDAHKRVASKVASFENDWKSPEKLARLAKWMDSEGIPLDKRLRSRGVDSWVEKLEADPVNFIKAIDYRQRRAKK